MLTDDHKPATRVIDGADMAKVFAGVPPALSVGYTIADALAERHERLRLRLYTSGLATGPDSADALIAEADRLASTGQGTAEDVIDRMISAASFGLDSRCRALMFERLSAALDAISREPTPPKRGNTRRSRQVRSTRARARRRVEQRVGRADVVVVDCFAGRGEWNTPRGAW